MNKILLKYTLYTYVKFAEFNVKVSHGRHVCNCLRKSNVIGKAQPRTGHEGREREYSCNCTLSLALALDGSQGHVPTALSPGKRPGTHCTRGWLGPRTGLDGCGKFRPLRDSIPEPLSL
jgi:hypothetical protein